MNQQFSDLLQLVDETELERECKRRNRRRRAAIAVVAVLLLLCAAATVAGAYARLLGKVNVDPGTRPAGYTVPEETTEAPDPDFPAMYDITDASSLHSFLRQWWNNGGEEEIRYSKDVFNVLLLGEDDPDGGEFGRSDSIMLVSVNKKTHTVTMLSFLRDSYCYMNIDGQEYWGRINAAFSRGGPAGMMETVTRLYKIRVDRYVSVGFSAFKKLINTLGGVTVDVTAAEAKFINRNAPSMKGQFPAGEGVRLNGAQALVYCRIRKLDSDNARAVRQQKVIQGIIAEARTASVGQIYDALGDVLEQVTTNFTQSEITALLPQAITWLTYGTQQMTSPLVDGSNRSAIGASINGAQIWVVDYPLAAQHVQLALYGESNINVESGGARSSYIIDLFRGAADRGTLEGDSIGTSPVTTLPEDTETGEDESESEEPPGEEEWTTEPVEEGLW
ncbi:MAG: LCP family protein [Oscillospiraceae bacterium]|jgi:LCP family protein required for cell wall assembly|nr:LCP family protein [Oscillospiraceae bacterium]